MHRKLVIKSYGSPSKGVFVDHLLLAGTSDILQRQQGKIDASNRQEFWKSFAELSNLAEICCLHDEIYYPAFDTNFTKLRDGDESYTKGILAELNKEKVLLPHGFLTIDDIQKDRVFNRWASSLRGVWKEYTDVEKITEEEVLNLFSGCLAEELLGTPYFPSIRNAKAYVPASGLILDMQIYSLLLEAYSHIRREEAKKTQLRNLIGGIREPAIPPITMLILSKISSSKEFVEELLIWRGKMKPLRQNMAELSELAASNIPMDKWLKQVGLIQKAINEFVQKYEFSDSRLEISRPSRKDFAGLSAKLGLASNEFSLDIKRMLGLGLDQILQTLRRRRIKPLPLIKKKLSYLRKASTHLNRVFGIQFNTEDFNVFKELANTYDKLWDFEVFDKTLSYERLAYGKLPPKPEFRKGVEEILYLEEFDFQLMLKEFNILLKAKIDNKYSKTDQLLDLGFTYLSKELNKKARSCFLAIIEFDKNASEAYHGLALTEEDPSKKENAFQSALKLASSNDAILNDYGKFLLDLKRIEKATEYFNKAIEENDHNEQAHSNLGMCFCVLKKYTKAREEFKKAISINPNFAGPWYGLGLVNHEEKKLKEAVENFDKAAELSPNESLFWERLGMASFDLENYTKAANALEKVLEIKKDNYEILSLYAVCLYLSQKYKQSITVFKRLSDLRPDEASNYSQWAYALYELGQYDEAIAKFKQAFDRDSSNPSHLISVGWVCIESSKFNKAKKIFQDLANKFPLNYEIRFWLGKSLWHLDKIELALEHFAESIELGYSDAETFYNMAVKLDRQENFEYAISFYDLALSIQPSDSKSLANLAADLMELGRLSEALENAQKACEYSPNDIINLNILASIYAKMDNKLKVKENLEKIIEIDDNDDSLIVKQARQVLEQLQKEDI